MLNLISTFTHKIPVASILVLVLWVAPANADEKVMDLIIVAGQSNAVGFDAKPSELPDDEVDSNILFWWRTGDPPPDEFDSTNSNRWTHLQPQPSGTPKLPKQGRQYGNFAQPEGGFGPEIGLARTLYRKEQKPLAFVKVAFSGTNLHRDWNHADSGEQGACYRALIVETEAAIAAAKKKGIILRPRAFAWIQGESDSNARDSVTYTQALDSMLSALRKDLDAANLIALVGLNSQYGNGTNKFVSLIVEQQKRTALADPRCEYVETSSATIANRSHFDSKGTLKVGQLYAESLLALEEKLQPERRHFTIVALGDSITKGVRSGVTAKQTFASLLETQLQITGTSVRVHNVGIGGERTDQALQRLDSILVLKPDIVTVMYGTNDSYVDQGKTESRITVDAYRSNLDSIVTELLRRGIQPVLMTEPRWSADASPNGLSENPNVRLEPYVVACRETAKKWKLPLVDHFARWTDSHANGVNLRDWTTDGCHPNPVGHEKLTAVMLPVIQQTIGPKLETRAKILAGKPIRIICFGDSVTGVYYHSGSRRAYTDMLGIALRRVSPDSKVEMINAGLSGHTTVNALARIDHDVLRHKPDLVTVMYGLNDMTRVPLEDYRANLKEIVQKCRAIGAEVVLATPNNVTTTSARPTQKLIQYCDAVREVAAEMNVTLCDTYRELDAVRGHADFDWQMLMSDPIHPNMDGHRRLATTLAQSITGLRVSLDNTFPQNSAIESTLSLLKNGQPVHILAMTPFDKLIKPALLEISPDAEISVESWSVENMTLVQIEKDAGARVRKLKPSLVLIAVPRSAAYESNEKFKNSYAWVMNWSLNFGPPTWDCVVVHPSVNDLSTEKNDRDDLVRRLVHAQDLILIDRPQGSEADVATILRNWLKSQTRRVK